MDTETAQSARGGAPSAQLGGAGQSALDLQVVVSHERLPALAEEQACYALLSVSLHRGARYERLPLNVCLLLDHSTSMNGARLQSARDAARHIVDRLRPEDSLGLVAFSDRADVLLPAQRNVDKAMAKAIASTLQPAGGTELFQGLGAGIREVVRGRTKTSINHLILLTDGRTYGDEQGCLELARWAGERQIGISPLGIGDDWNEELLDQVAALSGGRSEYIDSPRRVVGAFEAVISQLNRVIARQSSLCIVPQSSVTLHEAHQVAPDIQSLASTRDSETPAVMLGPLGWGPGKVVLMEFRIRDAAPGSRTLARVGVEADVPGVPEGRLSGTVDVVVEVVSVANAVGGVRISNSEIPAAILNALARVALFKMQEKMVGDVKAGQIESATQRLEVMATRLAAIGEMGLARSAMLEAGHMARAGTLSPTGRKKMRYGTRALSMIPKEVDNG